ncbi:MAG: hypothetical protein KW788_05290 [Candidatus Doudnabacteria bacterium]|nr:hypothetical protein [Candidatus Doudnabacteria bacterium]
MGKQCCVCQNEQVMLYSQELDMAWCDKHMPDKDDLELALRGFKDPRELRTPKLN